MSFVVQCVFNYKKRLNKINQGLVSIRLYHASKTRIVSTGLYVKTNEFKKGRIVRHKNSVEYNKLIASLINKAEKYYIDCINESNIFRIDACVKFLKSNPKSLSVINTFTRYMINQDVAESSRKQYNNLIVYLKKYNKELSFSDLTYSEIRTFESFLKRQISKASNKRLKTNYVSSLLSTFRMFCNEAIRDGKLKDNPFKAIRLKSETPKKAFLTSSEVEKIANYDDSELTIKTKQSKDMFLFCCYSGLRFSDVIRVKKSWIKNNTLSLKQQKTKDNSIVSLRIYKMFGGKAGEIIDSYKQEDRERIFIEQSYSKANDDIKEIAKLVGIEKPVTFHSSRHTFAVECLNKGISIETLSKLLGHASIMTTIQSYAEITSKRIDDEIDRLF